MSKRGTPLPWLGGLKSTFDNENPVNIERTQNKAEQKIIKTQAQNISGTLKIHIEKKGRAGKPVAILSHFSDPESQNTESLKLLCSRLKNTLACGGTVESSKIILTLRDLEKIAAALMQLNIRVV